MTLDDEVKTAWQRVEGDFRAARDSTFERLPERWATAMEEIRGTLAAHLGAEAVDARLAVPEPFVTYLQTVGGGRYRECDMGFYLPSPEGIVSEFRSSYKMYVTDPRPARTPADAGFWLWVGTWSDKHDFLICCDRGHPLFGYVVEMHDDHPYRSGADSGTGIHDSPSFISFLGWLARWAEPDSDEE